MDTITTVYYSLAIVAYGIFLIQFLMSFFGVADTDVDIDLDGDGIGDLSWGDIFSLKGFIHFLMGFAGWMSLRSLTDNIEWFDYPIGILLGVAFIFILMLVGKLLLKLQHEPTGEEDFNNCKGIITLIGEEEDYYFVTLPEFCGYEIKVYSKTKHSLGDEVMIIKSTDNIYYIV
jgi:hypothetical protein